MGPLEHFLFAVSVEGTGGTPQEEEESFSFWFGELFCFLLLLLCGPIVVQMGGYI